MWVVVAYDIPDDARRAKLHQRLKALLVPVQKSVFEGELAPGALARLRRLVEHRIDLEVDDVRIYVLCGSCRATTLLLGTARPVPSRRDPLVV